MIGAPIARLFFLVNVLWFTQVIAQNHLSDAGVGPPAYAADRQLALAVNGDLWVVQVSDSLRFADKETTFSSKWRQLTEGPAEDRDPAWMPGEARLVFSSNRSGTFDLWQVDANQADKPRRIVHSDAPDTEPTIASDGTIVWARGFGPDANLWIKKPGEDEKPLRESAGAEYSPSFSPDGQTIVYIRERKGRKQLRLLGLSDHADTLIVGDNAPEYPRWSPTGDRIVFSTRGSKPGVWLTTPEGQYTNLLSVRRAAASWSPDGRHLALVALPRRAPAYNGDPGGSVPRRFDTPIFSQPSVTFIAAPPPPDAHKTTLRAATPKNPSALFLQRFDRVANDLTDRYRFDQRAGREEWERLKKKSRAAAAVAKDEAAVEAAIYHLLRDRPPLRSEVSGQAVVSSAHPLATRAGLETLKKGGNVVDAAVAVSFALGVVEPDASGVGGYGEMLIYLNSMPAPVCIEFLTRVPEAASLTNGALSPLPQDGPVLANVPGTVAGMELAWKKYGSDRLKWQQLIEPAIELARKGFVLDDALPTTLAKEQERYVQYESSKALFFPNDSPLKAGDTLRNPDLAWTLSQIAGNGARAFYKGEVAKRMVEDLRGKGNVMTLFDLARYYAVERTPVMTTYRDYTVYSGPPPVSGGAALAGKLNLLEQFSHPKPMREDVGTLHRMIEAWKLAPSTRGRIADPGLWPVDLSLFTDKNLARERWESCFDPEQSISPEDSSCLDKGRTAAWGSEGVLDAISSTGTTAFVVADARGNMVAVTQTLGTWGGNFYVSPGLGFIYNDKLRSYGSDPKRYNARIPFARNVTSIAPTLVFKGAGEAKQPYLAVGAAGNAWITSAVYQIVAGVIDQGLGPQDAIEQPRFLVGMRRDPKDRDKVREIVVQVEDGFAPGVLQRLHELGHELQRISLRGELRMGYASAAVVENNQAKAGADPRRSGQAGAIKDSLH